VKEGLIPISLKWPILGNIAPGSTPKKRKTPPKGKGDRPDVGSPNRPFGAFAGIRAAGRQEGLVVGGGLAGMTSALSLAEQGFEVYLVEKDTDLGGMARRIHYTLEGMDVQAYMRDLIRKVYQHPLVHVSTDAPSQKLPGMWGIS
jgi:NADPH-dependent 2,4-dienoyl-CoA reductase/sulfur reductase-like enzyme